MLCMYISPSKKICFSMMHNDVFASVIFEARPVDWMLGQYWKFAESSGFYGFQ